VDATVLAGAFSFSSCGSVCSGGDLVLLADDPAPVGLHPDERLAAVDISPDHSALLVAPIQGGASNNQFWTLPVNSGTPHKLGELAGSTNQMIDSLRGVLSLV
jgi:hypothetical protein